MAESAAIDQKLSSAARELHDAAVAVAALPRPPSSPPRPSTFSGLDLGDGGDTPDRTQASSARAVDPPLSPHVRSIAAQSAARRCATGAGGGGGAHVAAHLPPRIPSATGAGAPSRGATSFAGSTSAAAAVGAYSSGGSGSIACSDEARQSIGSELAGNVLSLDAATAAAVQNLTPSRAAATLGSSRLPRPAAAVRRAQGDNSGMAGNLSSRSVAATRIDSGGNAAVPSDSPADEEAAIAAALPRDVQMNLLRSQLRMTQKVRLVRGTSSRAK